jgi:hypothetical protein
MTVDQPAPHEVRLVLRQDWGEVTRFMLFVLVLGGALFLIMPEARTAPAPLLGLVGAAIAWCAVAVTAEERYLFDRADRTVRVRRVSLLGRSEEGRSLAEVCAVQQAVSGPDDNRRVLELVTEDGQVRLRLPRRFNTLSALDHDTVGRLIAKHLGLPLRPARP